MNFLESIRTMSGASTVRVMAYGVLSPGYALPEGWLEAREARWLFEHESWEVSLCLDEFDIEAGAFRPSDVLIAMESVKVSTGADVCFCMFDTSFRGVDALFVEDCDSVYAYMNGAVVGFATDEAVRSSKAWADALGRLRVSW
jgi:hypothetical protein